MSTSWHDDSNNPPAGATGSATPDWLQTNDADVAGASSFTADLEAVVSDETQDSTNNNNNKKSKRKSSTTDDDATSSSSRPRLCSCMTISLLIVSCIFMGLFIFSAIVQDNDFAARIQWIVFYSLHATLAAAFILYYLCWFPEKVLYLLSLGMAVWSIVYIIIAAIQLSKTEKGGPDTENGRSEFEDIAYELGGSCIALLNALYHGCMVKCCVNKSNNTGKE